jgi:hypothetical protein
VLFALARRAPLRDTKIERLIDTIYLTTLHPWHRRFFRATLWPGSGGPDATASSVLKNLQGGSLAAQLRRLKYVRDECFGVSECSDNDDPTRLSHGRRTSYEISHDHA